MAMIVDQQSNFKHFCKICKKGFGCGRALGGHMRAHGIGDETGHMDDDDPASDWENNAPPSNKRMYALRTNPNRLKSCRVCENCGKEFLSWKSFLEHGKCTSEDVESPISSPGSEADDGAAGANNHQRGYNWSKRKRSLRTKVGSFNYNCPSNEEEDLANCLMMLSNAIVDPVVVEQEDSCASASKGEERIRNPMNFIAPLSCNVNNNVHVDTKAKGVAKGLFECKACKKVFNSHQALGGHRASHKKVKGCFAAKLDNYLDDNLAEDDVITQEESFFPTKLQYDTVLGSSSSKRKSKVHECSICHRSFSSGQALGGHKRCHWITSNATTPDTSTLARFQQQFQEHVDHQIPKFDHNNSSEPLDLKLDLNLPASANDLTRRNNVSTEIYLQPWVSTKDIIKDKDNNNNNNNNNNNSQLQSVHHHNQVENDNNGDKNNNNTNNNNNNQNNVLVQNVENEADSKMKMAKLSELKDMNMGGSSSHWLQVGIGSTTDAEADT